MRFMHRSSSCSLKIGQVLGLMMALLIAAAPAVAKSKKAKGEGKGKAEVGSMGGKAPYGRAGCGLGSLVFNRDDTGPQIGAYTSNVTGVQTFGITSGTSNCVGGHTTVADVEQQVFITANLSSLSKEAAQGAGMHLSGLAQVFGCSADVGEPALGRLSQQHYDALFVAPEPSVVLQNYLHEIRSHAVLAKDCTKVAAS